MFAYDYVVCTCLSVCVPVRLNVFVLSLQRGLTIRETHSSLWVQRAIKQGNVPRDMFYSPTSQFIFNSPPSWCVCQLCPGWPSHCSPFIVECFNQYWTVKNRKGCCWDWGNSTLTGYWIQVLFALCTVRLLTTGIFKTAVQSPRRTLLLLCRTIMGREVHQLGVNLMYYNSWISAPSAGHFSLPWGSNRKLVNSLAIKTALSCRAIEIQNVIHNHQEVTSLMILRDLILQV